VRIVLWMVFIVLLVAFQGSLLNPFVTIVDWEIRPDLILIAVYLFGLIKGDIRGGFLGALLGFIVDVISAGPVYFNVFSKSFAGYFAGVVSRWIQYPGVILQGSLISGVSLLQGLGIFFVHTITGMARFPGDLIYIVIPQALLDGLLGGALFWLLTFRRRRVESRYGVFMRDL